MRKQIKIMFVSGMVVFCLLIMGLWIFMDTPSRDSRVDAENFPHEVLQKTSSNEKTGEKAIKKAKLSTMVRNALKSYQNSGEQPAEEDDPMMTEERMALRDLHNKTDPYFWEMAPQIIEEMWKNDTPDDQWQEEIEKAAEEIVPDGKYDGTNLTYVDCKKILCKIGFEHRDAASFRVFKDGDMDNGPWISKAGNSLGGYKILENGKIASFRYFTKPGDIDTFRDMRRIMFARLEGSTP
jgi:hypothetical protein